MIRICRISRKLNKSFSQVFQKTARSGDISDGRKRVSVKQISRLRCLLGKHFIYTYENGRKYELYIKNANTIDYRIHSGMVDGRWVRDQLAHIVRIAPTVVKISWDEPTGTAVSLALNVAERSVHGVIFFPRSVAENPAKAICFQNDHLDEMQRLRDAGPTYPRLAIDEFAKITLMEDCGQNNEEIIRCGPDQLASGYAERPS